jgi:mitogen-activated protein kinase organizer 1
MTPPRYHTACLQDDVTSVAAVGAAILAASVDGCVRRFDIRMGRVYTDDLHHSVASLAISHDGLCVLTACLDSHLRLLDVQAGELLASYSGHTHEAVRMGCAFTADDQHVIGCSEDGECEVLSTVCACSVVWIHLCAK